MASTTTPETTVPTTTTTAPEPVPAPVANDTPAAKTVEEDTPTVAPPQPAQVPAEVAPEVIHAEATPVPASEPTPVVPEPTTQPQAEASLPEAPSEVTPAPETTPAPATAEPEPTIAVKAPEPTPVPTSTDTPQAPEPAPAPTAIVEEPAMGAATSTTPPPPAPEPVATKDAVKTEVKEVKKVDFKEAEEPQNALTERFTSAEWKALKEFRALLPQVLAQAYPDNPKASETPIKLWGIELNPQEVDAPKDARVSVLLMKFLRARHLSPTSAQEMMVATLRWRELFGVDAAMKEEFPAEIFGQLGHVFGTDTEGHPVVYNLYGANKDLKAVFGDVQRFLRWRVKLMEESVLALNFETVDQMVQVHDYEGVSLSSRDANSKQAASEASSIFQNHYPEFLYRKFFINVPTLMNWIFWLFKPLMPAATLAKMSVVGSGTHAIRKALSPVIGDKNLPTRYGGEAEAF
ncbi:Non-classical phosphatidylinositol transfer protein (PITP) [Pleurotus ostreatus]|nr:Non-classical phosphatidylinositol transfer protein (PITP) [Pleurotus ostreatus]